MSEHDNQCAVIQWKNMLQNRYIALGLLFAVPNGAKLPWARNKRGQRYSKEAINLLNEGLQPGVPDLILPVARHGYHGLAIENKYGRNKLTQEQKWWISSLEAQGWLTAVCYSADEAIGILRDYLDIPEFEVLT